MTGSDGGAPDPSDIDRLAARLGVWAADAAARDAAAERARRRWLADQAAAEATLRGALVDLAEDGQRVVVRTPSAAFSGTVSAVGRDFCVVATPAGSATVALHAVVAVEPAGPPPPTSPGREPLGSREPPVDLALADVAGVLAADRLPVVAHLRGGAQLTGTLVRGGPELLVIVPTASHDRRPRVAPLAAVEALAPAPG